MEPPFTDVLVPLDRSPAAERALGPALDLVQRTGVPLRVMSRALPDEVEGLATYLAEVADRYAGVTDVETQVVDRESIPDAIIESLEPETLVCMSSHGRGGIGRAVMGSVAEAVLRMLGRPALVVGPRVAGDDELAGRIVACVDGSPESERTIGPARRWAAGLELPLGLVEVAEPGSSDRSSPPGDVSDLGYVAGLAHEVGDVDAWDVLHGADPARALIDLAASEATPVAMLVMATHGRTGWNRLRLGSVTVAVLHGAAVPVLVVPAGPER